MELDHRTYQQPPIKQAPVKKNRVTVIGASNVQGIQTREQRQLHLLMQDDNSTRWISELPA